MDAIADKTFGNEGKKVLKEESPSLLTIIVDTNPIEWHKISDKLSMKSMIQSLLIGINAHLSINNSNNVAIIASHCDGAVFLYPSRDAEDGEGELGGTAKEEGEDSDEKTASPELDPQQQQDIRDLKHEFISSSMYRQFKTVNEQLIDSLYKLIKSSEGISKPPRNYLSSSLSLALTYINKIQQLNPIMKARVLIINLSQDEHLKYIPIMNCIFASQKLKVPIDVCQLGKTATFLQQASDSTNGVYLQVENYQGLVQYLTVSTLFLRLLIYSY